MKNLTVILLLLLLVLPLATLKSQGSSDTYRFAYDQGFTEGEAAGRSDRNENQGYDYSRWPSFLTAESGFDEQVHDREVFSVAYRRGFKDGYENGYNNPRLESQSASQASGETASEPLEENPATDDWILPGGTKMIVRLLDPLSTELNNQGDEFVAELAEDVVLTEFFFIPEGTRIYGVVSHLKRAGRIRGRAEMELQFNRLEIRRGYSIALNAELVGLIQTPRSKVETEDGTLTQESGTSQDAGRIGASSGIGALIGAITGGAVGAGKGAIVGATGGLVGTILTRGDDINLLTETEVVIRLAEDLRFPKERFQD